MIWDIDDGDFCIKMSDDMLMDSDGNMMHMMSDNMALDLDSGDIHYITGYSSDEVEDE